MTPAAASTVILESVRNLDGETAYQTADGFTVERVSGKLPWAIFHPAITVRYARNLDGVRAVIAALRQEV